MSTTGPLIGSRAAGPDAYPPANQGVQPTPRRSDSFSTFENIERANDRHVPSSNNTGWLQSLTHPNRQATVDRHLDNFTIDRWFDAEASESSLAYSMDELGARQAWGGQAGVSHTPPIATMADRTCLRGNDTSNENASGDLNEMPASENRKDTLPGMIEDWEARAVHETKLRGYKSIKQGRVCCAFGCAALGAVCWGVAGAAVGSIFGPVGTIVGGVVCGVIGVVVGGVYGYREDDADRLTQTELENLDSRDEFVRDAMQNKYRPEINACLKKERDDSGQPTLPPEFSRLADAIAMRMAYDAKLPLAAIDRRAAFGGEMAEAMKLHLYGQLLCLKTDYSSLDLARDLNTFGQQYLAAYQRNQGSIDEIQGQRPYDCGRLARERHAQVIDGRPVHEIAEVQSRLLSDMCHWTHPDNNEHVKLDEAFMQAAMGKENLEQQVLDDSHPIHELRARLDRLRTAFDGDQNLPLRHAIDLQLRMCDAAGAKSGVIPRNVGPTMEQLNQQVFDGLQAVALQRRMWDAAGSGSTVSRPSVAPEMDQADEKILNAAEAIVTQVRMYDAAISGSSVVPEMDQVDQQILDALVDLEACLQVLGNARYAS